MRFSVPEALESLWEQRIREETDKDRMWESFMHSETTIESVMSLDDHVPQPYDSDTGGPYIWDGCLEASGWNLLDSSVRVVYYKLNAVLKIAVDASGLIQNFMECLAYGDNAENLDETGSSDGVSVLRIPRLITHHDRYYWVMQQMVPEGICPKKVPADFLEMLKEWRFEDLRTENFVLNANPGREEYWFYDLGCYCYDPLERQSVLWRM